LIILLKKCIHSKFYRGIDDDNAIRFHNHKGGHKKSNNKKQRELAERISRPRVAAGQGKKKTLHQIKEGSSGLKAVFDQGAGVKPQQGLTFGERLQQSTSSSSATSHSHPARRRPHRR
jgi:hypothetical protein